MEAVRDEEVAGLGWSRLRWLLILALLARLAALAIWSENLTDDQDGYLALADGLASGRGYSSPGSQTPTAYRPPLYPLLLVPSAFLPSGLWVAVLQVGLGLATVWLTSVLAGRLSLSRCVAALAAAWVAVDPILLRYATLPMTETLATCLITALLVVVTARRQRATDVSPWRRSTIAGGLFGLAALCRPTIWAFAGLAAVWYLTSWMRQRFHRPPVAASETFRDRNRLRVWLVIAAAAVVLLPWGWRNLQQFGRPILMTTHGGYTLLLGNNPKFVCEVVDQPWGTVWDGTHGGGQAAWAEAINRQMDQEQITGEVARDRWMRDRAFSNIRADPAAFGRACWLRMRRFWGLMPIEGASDQSRWVRCCVGVFYGVMFVGAILGLVQLRRRWSPGWIPSLLMAAAFMGVHLVYWTNIRMRAPIVPALAILSAAGWCRLWEMFPNRGK